jgi:BolA protein
MMMSDQQRSAQGAGNGSGVTEAHGPVQASIVRALQRGFPDAVHLEVHNESSLHAVPRGSETHFRIVVACERFAGMTRLARHRCVQQVIAAESSQVKAIALRPITPEEWRSGLGGDTAPNCRGG